MGWDSSSFGRPPRWMRIVASVLAVLFALRLILSHQPLDILETVVLCGVFGFTAVAPRAFYDGRVAAWERAHPVFAAVTLFLFFCLLLFNALANWLSPLVSALIAAGFSAVFVPFVVWLGRRSAARRSRESVAGD